ncbi:MAG: polyphenol oxidase family protein, partial [Acidobacteria bacterium]|nr:polyphenol oxidase family protein [Acidobacteriota bacterium]
MTADLTLLESGLARFDGLPAGFRAGFTTRRLTPDGTSPEEALRSLADALGAPLVERVRLRQVHGRTVLHAAESLRAGEDVLLGEGDAVVTAEASRLLAVQTADCVPILLLDPETGLLAAVHAGWRGTALRILDPVLDLLESLGAKPGNLLALFGPS